MLLLALLLAQPAAETAAVVDVPPLAISSVSPAAFPTASATVVALEGSGFVLGVPTGWRLRCRLTSACPTNGHECTTFTHAGYGGGALYANATVLNDTHATCVAPAVFAPGPGLLSLCIDQGVWLCNSPSNGMKISYFTLVDAVLGRRPYFNESQGELLITAHSSLAGRALRLEASLGFVPNKRFSWTVTPTAAKLTAVLPFALAGLPTTTNADLRLDVDYGAGNLTIWRRLIRSPLPTDPAAAAAAVQVDHSTMALRVGGEIFQGSGWFVGIPKWPPSHWLPCTHLPINTTVCTALWLATIRPRAALGTLTQIMPYGLQTLHPPAQLAFLDACAILGVKVMYDMQPLGMTALGGMNYDTDWASATWKADVEANVSLVRNHPAILGYYICDDCCPIGSNLGNVSKQAKLYNLIKSLAPTKLVIGAIQCANAWQWTDVPSAPVHPDPVPETAVIPIGVQPRLQLSLDVLMIENYNGLVSQHAGGGSWSTGALGDGTLRHGAERAIITNIHGLWSQGQGSINDFRNYPAAPEQSRSMMWLGVITAMMFNSLTFEGTFGWGAPTVPGGGWLQEIQQEIWAAQVEQLMPSFTAPFGTVQHPLASVTSAKCLRPSAHAVVDECADPIRVRAWRELCNQTSELCVHAIVVNIALDSPVQFQLTIDGLGLTAATNATRLFDAAYNTTVSQQGILADYAGPSESLIYEIGCHEAAPKQLSTPTFPDVNDGRPQGIAGVSPWESCMNRRVLCKDGFVEKSPFNATCQPPGAAAAVHTTLKTDDGELGTTTTF